MAGRIEYVFEVGTAHEREIDRMCSQIEQHRDFSRRFRWGKYRFVEKSPDTPWLFGADYFAWEWQRYDKNSGEAKRSEWRTTILSLIEAKPHLASVLTAASVNTQAMINSVNGLLGPHVGGSDVP